MKIKNQPKLYYYPNEIKSDYSVIKLSFVDDDLSHGTFGNRIYTITYEKVHFKNSKYDYVYVMSKMKEEFINYIS